MQINIYSKIFQEYFNSNDFFQGQKEAIALLRNANRLFFIGNGGSNAICSHMMEDFAKIAGYETYGFSDPALITCFANDFGYEKAIQEWLKIYFKEGDVLIAVSSSGNSPNIVNAIEEVKNRGKVITLSGFESNNKIFGIGEINFHIPISNYGVVECFHQVILHVLLDEISAAKIELKEGK